MSPWDAGRVVVPNGFRFLTRVAGFGSQLAERVLGEVANLAAIRRASDSTIMQWPLLSRFEKARILAARQGMDVRARDRSAQVEHAERP